MAVPAPLLDTKLSMTLQSYCAAVTYRPQLCSCGDCNREWYNGATSSLDGGPEGSEEPWDRQAWLDKYWQTSVKRERGIAWVFHCGNGFGDGSALDYSELQVRVSCLPRLSTRRRSAQPSNEPEHC